jgi:chitodextrinase
MNKLVLALGFVTFQFLGFSQNGLEKIIVEKYYISKTADSIGSLGTLPVGSTTYRVYVDMLPGYRFQALYGNADHTLKINSSNPFFNNEDRGATTANGIPSAQLKNNTVAIDSWFSVGASAGGQFGVLKSEDNDGKNLLTLNSLLKNNEAAMGIPLTTQDGNMTVTGKQPEAVTFVGLDPSGGIFDAISLQGNSFQTNDGAISALNGATGPTAENRVLIGQFTTNGVFTFELNIQIGTPTPGVSEKYVASNPVNGEFSIPSLILSGNNPPVVEVTSPSNDAKLKSGVATTITANATDSDGTITSVEFFEDGKSIGVDTIAPYSIEYTPTDGTHQITAKATDNQKATTTSSSIKIIVINNIAPVVTIKVPKKARIGAVTLEANATDEDGTIKHVEFYVDSALVGKDSIAPYTYDWSAVLGKHTVYAIATDDKEGKGSSNKDSIEIFSNILPEIAIVSPTNNDTKIIKGTNVLIQATASDADGKVKQVEFFVDGNTVGIDSVTPYTANYTAVVGKHLITAVVTDNQLEKTTSSSVTIEVIANILPQISIVTPTGNDTKLTTGDTLLILANATDENGKVRTVEFFVDNKSIGIDSVTPYTANYPATKGTHYITAVVTDDQLAKTTSSSVMIEVLDNQLPIVSISNYFETIYKQDVVKITANAYDIDGTITDVEFFVDSVSVGVDQIAPYSTEWIATPGIHNIKAVAKDNNGAKKASIIKTIDVKNYLASISEENMTNNSLKIYPNPASTIVNFEIKTSNKETFTNYQIVDNIGRVVLEKTIKNSQDISIETIDIQQFEKGIYHFQSTVDGNLMVEKFIVE